MATHVIEESHGQNSVLQDALAECERLCVEVGKNSTKARSVEEELVGATATIEQLHNAGGAQEVDQLKQAVKKESLKAKKFWKQRCEQMLKHEEEIDTYLNHDCWQWKPLIPHHDTGLVIPCHRLWSVPLEGTTI